MPLGNIYFPWWSKKPKIFTLIGPLTDQKVRNATAKILFSVPTIFISLSKSYEEYLKHSGSCFVLRYGKRLSYGWDLLPFKKGWFETTTFCQLFKLCFLPNIKNLEGKKVISGDNLNSVSYTHLTLPTILRV